LFFCDAGAARANRKIHFTTPVRPVAFRAHAESAYCDNSIVPLLNTAFRVTFLAPVILRGAIYCTGVAVRICEKRDRNGRPIRSPFLPPASLPRRVTLKNNSEKHRFANHLST